MAILLLATTPISASQARRSDLFVLRFRRDWPQDFQMLDQYRTRDGLVLAKNKGVDRGAIEHEFFSEARPTSIIQRFETPEEIASLILFHYDQGDVVGLRHALREFVNSFQERPIERFTSQGRLAPNDLEQALFAEHFALLIFRFRKAVGIHHQNVSLGELKRAGLVRCEIEHSQEIMFRGKLFDSSGGRPKQAGRSVSRADELSHPI